MKLIIVWRKTNRQHWKLSTVERIEEAVLPTILGPKVIFRNEAKLDRIINAQGEVRRCKGA
jgi:hypothetical protein